VSNVDHLGPQRNVYVIGTKAVFVGFATAALIVVSAAAAEAHCMASYAKPPAAATLHPATAGEGLTVLQAR
jgi:hypothetical protein